MSKMSVARNGPPHGRDSKFSEREMERERRKETKVYAQHNAIGFVVFTYTYI